MSFYYYFFSEYTVNNVGYLTPYPKLVTETSREEAFNIININIGATVEMTRIILPQMRKKKRGVIVNISSLSEICPLPFFSIYGASKVR